MAICITHTTIFLSTNHPEVSLSFQVDLYACRDLDSRFTAREASAVEEWLSIDQPIHSMRDHPNHNTPLLGAAWGADMRY
jgi:hypothetical protein